MSQSLLTFLPWLLIFIGLCQVIDLIVGMKLQTMVLLGLVLRATFFLDPSSSLICPLGHKSCHH